MTEWIQTSDERKEAKNCQMSKAGKQGENNMDKHEIVIVLS